MTGPVRAVVIVAHPDDEILWCGGWILDHPDWRWTIVSLCRGKDPDRAPRFSKVIAELGAIGGMANLDDSPDQAPLALPELLETLGKLIPAREYDICITHSPEGEYTRHRRHEETSLAVMTLLQNGRLTAQALYLFAFQDENRSHYPQAISDADIIFPLSDQIWNEKRRLIRELYGFSDESWEAKTTPQVEAFWVLDPGDPTALKAWIQKSSQGENQ